MKKTALFYATLICVYQVITPALAEKSLAALNRIELEALAKFEETPAGESSAIEVVATQQMARVCKTIIQQYGPVNAFNYPNFITGFNQGINNYVTYRPRPVVQVPVVTNVIQTQAASNVQPPAVTMPSSSSDTNSQLISLLQTILGPSGLASMLINALITAIMSGMSGATMMPVTTTTMMPETTSTTTTTMAPTTSTTTMMPDTTTMMEDCSSFPYLLTGFACYLTQYLVDNLNGLESLFTTPAMGRIANRGLTSLRADSTNMRDQLSDSLSKLGAARVLPSGRGSPLSSFLSLIQDDEEPLTQLLLEMEPLTL